MPVANPKEELEEIRKKIHRIAQEALDGNSQQVYQAHDEIFRIIQDVPRHTWPYGELFGFDPTKLVSGEEAVAKYLFSVICKALEVEISASMSKLDPDRKKRIDHICPNGTKLDKAIVLMGMGLIKTGNEHRDATAGKMDDMMQSPFYKYVLDLLGKGIVSQKLLHDKKLIKKTAAGATGDEDSKTRAGRGPMDRKETAQDAGLGAGGANNVKKAETPNKEVHYEAAMAPSEAAKRAEMAANKAKKEAAAKDAATQKDIYQTINGLKDDWSAEKITALVTKINTCDEKQKEKHMDKLKNECLKIASQQHDECKMQYRNVTEVSKLTESETELKEKFQKVQGILGQWHNDGGVTEMLNKWQALLVIIKSEYVVAFRHAVNEWKTKRDALDAYVKKEGFALVTNYPKIRPNDPKLQTGPGLLQEREDLQKYATYKKDFWTDDQTVKDIRATLNKTENGVWVPKDPKPMFSEFRQNASLQAGVQSYFSSAPPDEEAGAVLA